MTGSLSLAKLTLKAALRSKTAVFAVAAYVVILAATVVLAPKPEKAADEQPPNGGFSAEQTLDSPEAQRIRFVQASSLGAAFFLAVLIVAVSGSTWLPQQIKEKQITTVLSKPVGAWRVVAGCWLGYGALVAVLFVIFAALSIGCCRVLAAVSTGPGDASAQLQTLYTQEAEGFGRVSLESTEADSLPPGSIHRIEAAQAEGATLTLSDPQSAAVWTFEDGAREGNVRFRAVFEIQKRSNPYVDYTDLEMRLWNPQTGALGPPARADLVASGRLFEFSLPAPDASWQTAGVMIRPLNAGFDVVCQWKGLLNVKKTAPFEFNYFKSFALSGLAVLVFAAITMAASTFLSSNVSVFFSASVGVMGGVVSFFRDFLGAGGREGFGVAAALGATAPNALLDPAADGWEVWARTIGHTLLQAFSDGVELIFKYILPDWTKFDSSQDVLSRLSISFGERWPAFIYAGVYCLVCIVAGGWILKRREVGKG